MPIIQGSTFTFLVPIIAIMSLPQWNCPDSDTISNLTTTEADEIWMPRMREVSFELKLEKSMKNIFGVKLTYGGMFPGTQAKLDCHFEFRSRAPS